MLLADDVAEAAWPQSFGEGHPGCVDAGGRFEEIHHVAIVVSAGP
jgi:hypothetical protein